MIAYGKQDISLADIQSVVSVLESDFLTQGPSISRFEELIAGYCNVSSVLACSNGTAALHLACLALGIGDGDLVWTSPNTFVASANCALYCGATVDFVDICSETYNLSVRKLAEKLKIAEKKGKLPTLVIPVHFAGQPCDMKAIKDLSNQYGFRILEDASHAIGGKYEGSPVGSCEYSDACVFSFHPVKIITTGEGGAITTNNQDLAEKLNLLRTHGITRDPSLMEGESHGPWYYQQIDLGYNYRITDIQCALGASQIERLDNYIHKRQELAQYYQNHLEGLPIKWQTIRKNRLSAYHLFMVEVDPARRKELYLYLSENGIGVNVHYIPVHTQPHYQNLGFNTGDFPNAEKYYAGAITLPLFPTLKPEEQDKVIRLLKEFSW